MRNLICIAAALIVVPGIAWAAGGETVGENLLWLALILMSARLLSPLAAKFGFPAVLGEVGGIVLRAALFLVGSIAIGRARAPHSSRWLARLAKGHSMLFAQVLGVTAAAVAGKLVAGFAAGPGVRHRIAGWGMVPRGEVGLIFAMVGNRLGVIDATPPILTPLMRKAIRQQT